MSEQEAQQAQTIARIKRQKYFQTTRGAAVNLLVRDKDDLLEIVDSQAQKIAQQAKEIERLKSSSDLKPLDSEHGRLRA